MHLEPFVDLRLAESDDTSELEPRQPARLEPVENCRRRERETLGELGRREEALAHRVCGVLRTGTRPAMTDSFEGTAREDEGAPPVAPSEPSPVEPATREPRDDEEHEDEQQDRAPQPGVTPAPDDD
jgi:hypothetical protein